MEILKREEGRKTSRWISKMIKVINSSSSSSNKTMINSKIILKERIM